MKRGNTQSSSSNKQGKFIPLRNSSSNVRAFNGKDIKNGMPSQPISNYQPSLKINQLNLKSSSNSRLHLEPQQKGTSMQLRKPVLQNYQSQSYLQPPTQRMQTSHRNASSYIEQNQQKFQPQDIKISQYLKSQSSPIPSSIRSAQSNPAMRKLVVEWMIELSHKLNFKNKETLFISVYLFDLMAECEKDLNPKNMQLLALTVMFVAGKYEEIYPPQIQNYIEAACHAYSKTEIIRLEEKLLGVTNFKLTFPTRWTFLPLCTGQNSQSQYLRQYDREAEYGYSQYGRQSYEIQGKHSQDKRFPHFLQFLLELSLLSHWEDCYENDIAESAVFLSCKVMKKPIPTKLTPTNKVMQNAYRLIEIWRDNQNGAVASLYDSDKYSFVGGLKIIS